MEITCKLKQTILRMVHGCICWGLPGSSLRNESDSFIKAQKCIEICPKSMETLPQIQTFKIQNLPEKFSLDKMAWKWVFIHGSLNQSQKDSVWQSAWRWRYLYKKMMVCKTTVWFNSKWKVIFNESEIWIWKSFLYSVHLFKKNLTTLFSARHIREYL